MVLNLKQQNKPDSGKFWQNKTIKIAQGKLESHIWKISVILVEEQRNNSVKNRETKGDTPVCENIHNVSEQ